MMASRYFRLLLSERQNHRCCICGIRMSDIPGRFDSATFEHVIPKRVGGKTSEANCVVTCSQCNRNGTAWQVWTTFCALEGLPATWHIKEAA